MAIASISLALLLTTELDTFWIILGAAVCSLSVESLDILTRFKLRVPRAAFATQGGAELTGSVQGLKTATRAAVYSFVSRDTTVSPWCCAVAAIMRSG